MSALPLNFCSAAGFAHAVSHVGLPGDAVREADVEGCSLNNLENGAHRIWG